MVLKELTQLRGVSGNEKAVREYIIEHAKQYADEVRVDRMGNVIAHKKGSGAGSIKKHVMLAAHMDEIGMIVKWIDEGGFLRYDTVGGIDPRVMVSKRVLIGEKGVSGVIGAKAIHLQSAEDRQRPLGHDQLYIDIGATDKASAEKLVSCGDYVSLMSEYVEFGEGFVKDKALDDRVGCYNLLRVLMGNYPCDVTCAFTVQEEIGLKGARVAGYLLDTDCAIILEGTTANDLGDTPEHLRVCQCGKGVAISFMDTSSIGHRGLNKALRDLGEEKEILWQIKTFVSGGNDAGAIQTTHGPKPTCVLSVPCRNIHSHASVACLKDVEAQYQLVDAFLAAGAQFNQ